MNEQLVVKNFGPIKDATVDFKRVTVFIGPTGGGKSTLAKLKYALSEEDILFTKPKVLEVFDTIGLGSYPQANYSIKWLSSPSAYLEITDNTVILSPETISYLKSALENNRVYDNTAPGEYYTPSSVINRIEELIKGLSDKKLFDPTEGSGQFLLRAENAFRRGYLAGYLSIPLATYYIPAERLLISALNLSWPSLIEAKVNLPSLILDFSKLFLHATITVKDLLIPFLAVTIKNQNDKSMVQAEDGSLLQLAETASGIQSVTPLLVLLEHLSRNTEQAQSFIIEEPELNLYPTAQRDLVYWLLEKCTQGENDLTITTHSPYVLSALNLALYASKVATLFPHQRQKVAKLIPEKYWLKAEEFSAYFVAKGGAKSIFDPKTGLLNESQLDEVSGEFADVFDRLTDLRIPEKKAPAKAKPARK